VRALHRHGLLGDVHLAAVAFAALLVSGAYGHEGRGIDLLGVLAAAAATAPLLVRRRYPVAVLALTTAGIFATLETLKATEAVALAPMVALYTVAATGPRNRAFGAAGAMAVVAVLALAIYSPHPVLHEETVKNLALVALPVALGVGVRDRRRYIAAIHERAERAEATREEEALRRVEQERLRIAREVHDVVAHAMVAINVQAGVAAHVIDRRPEAARSALTEIKRVSGAALADLRATLGVLREADAPAPVRPAQGLDALEELAARVRAAGIDVTIDARLDGEDCPPIPSALEGAAFPDRPGGPDERRAPRGRPLRRGARARRAEALELEVIDDGAGGRARPPTARATGCAACRARGRVGGRWTPGRPRAAAGGSTRGCPVPVAGRGWRERRAARPARATTRALVLAGFGALLEAEDRIEVAGTGRERGGGRSRSPAPWCPTWSSWTCACPGWTAWRPRADSPPTPPSPGSASWSSRRSSSTSTCSARCGPGRAASCSRTSTRATCSPAIRVVASGEALLAPRVTRRLSRPTSPSPSAPPRPRAWRAWRSSRPASARSSPSSPRG
jgi:signal transduction histidine kinase